MKHGRPRCGRVVKGFRRKQEIESEPRQPVTTVDHENLLRHCDGDDRLRNAVKKSLDQQSPLPLIKEELRVLIQCRRLAEGIGDIEATSTFKNTPHTYELTEEELAKVRKRKVINRDSASRSRRKHKAYLEELQQRYCDAKIQRDRLSAEIAIWKAKLSEKDLLATKDIGPDLTKSLQWESSSTFININTSATIAVDNQVQLVTCNKSVGSQTDLEKPAIKCKTDSLAEQPDVAVSTVTKDFKVQVINSYSHDFVVRKRARTNITIRSACKPTNKFVTACSQNTNKCQQCCSKNRNFPVNISCKIESFPQRSDSDKTGHLSYQQSNVQLVSKVETKPSGAGQGDDDNRSADVSTDIFVDIDDKHPSNANYSEVPSQLNMPMPGEASSRVDIQEVYTDCHVISVTLTPI